MTEINRIVAAVAAMVAAPLALSGCAASADEFEELVPPAVLASDSHIVDTAMSFSNGLAGRGFSLRIYVTDTSDAAVAAAIDAAAEAAYHASPSRPTSIYLDVAEPPRPERVNLGARGISLDGARELLWPDVVIINDVVHLASGDLEKLYGPWGEAG